MTEASTNDDKPFSPGEIIVYAGERYEVVENWGRGGTVREYPGGQGSIRFYWSIYGETCRRVSAEP
jgi:hypothetical protein